MNPLAHPFTHTRTQQTECFSFQVPLRQVPRAADGRKDSKKIMILNYDLTKEDMMRNVVPSQTPTRTHPSISVEGSSRTAN